jgi:purine-binding chemotaxis protein CheW
MIALGNAAAKGGMPARRAEPAAPQSFSELLTFEIAGARFGIPLAAVREIIRAVAFARLPKAPRVVEGVINLRGSVVPVLDIRARFRLPSKAIETSDHFIVAQAYDRVVAIHVDRAIDLLRLEQSEIENMTAVAPTSEYIAGVAKLPDGLVLIHDLTTFLSEAEAEALAAIDEEPQP